MTALRVALAGARRAPRWPQALGLLAGAMLATAALVF